MSFFVCFLHPKAIGHYNFLWNELSIYLSISIHPSIPPSIYYIVNQTLDLLVQVRYSVCLMPAEVLNFRGLSGSQSLVPLTLRLA